jgi:hypothetical protein
MCIWAQVLLKHTHIHIHTIYNDLTLECGHNQDHDRMGRGEGWGVGLEGEARAGGREKITMKSGCLSSSHLSGGD